MEQREKRNRKVAEQKKTKQNLSWKYSNNKDGKGEKRAKKHYYPDELLSPCSRNRSQSKRRDIALDSLQTRRPLKQKHQIVWFMNNRRCSTALYPSTFIFIDQLISIIFGRTIRLFYFHTLEPHSTFYITAQKIFQTALLGLR